MRRPNIINAIKKGLDALPLDIEVWLYGSEARGDARPDSDIDLLVLFNKPKVTFEDEDKIYNVTYPIELESGIPIQLFILPKEKWESRMTPFRDNVLTDRMLRKCFIFFANFAPLSQVCAVINNPGLTVLSLIFSAC